MKTFKTLFVALVTLASWSGLSAQVGQAKVNLFDASTIPDDLKKDAYKVKRDEKVEIELSQPDKGSIKTYSIITILDSKGADELIFHEYADKFRILEDVDIRFFDANGKLISRHSKKDMITSSAGSGLVEDGKGYYLRLNTTNYPVTVEATTVYTIRTSLQLPSYYPQLPYQAVENSQFIIKYATSLGVKYKTYNGTMKAEESSTDPKYLTYRFNVRNIPAKKYEENSGPWTQYFPHVRFNSSRFTFDGFPGDLSSWKELGNWYNRLASSVNKLSEKNQQEIQQMVKHLPSDIEKARFLYNYLQRNFRYVSIQLGIGGFRPFPADFVHDKKYGDCKGLSNYLEACLSAVKIKSYSAWINAGADRPAVDPEFPFDQFNHQILCVLIGKDSIWLECTSNYNDFGHLGNFTENRNALLMTENGGVLVKTPRSKPVENMSTMITKVKFAEDGSGDVHATQYSTGEYKYAQINISKESAEVQKNVMINRMGFSNPDEYEIKYLDQDKPATKTEYSLTLEKIPDFIAGSKMFIRPRMYKFWGVKMPAVEKRNNDYLFDFPLSKKDTTMFVIPEGYELDVLPAPKNLTFEYGKYESSYWYDSANRTVYSSASLVLNQYRIPALRYNDTKTFMDKILEDENQKLIIKKL
ncbi:DUF3857 domain-containing protein [Pollutibacter soli]|uniref:DUF3857 domain-containing protein n=1 Tax=Pollutibacter soli TaxID=3034157 RepID=UPI0030133087